MLESFAYKGKKNAEKKNNKVSIGDVLFVFLYVFRPPIISISMRWLLELYMIGYILLKGRKLGVLYFPNQIKKYFLGFTPFFIYFFVYFLFFYFANSNTHYHAEYLNNLYVTLIVPIHLVVLLLYCSLVIQRKGYSIQQIEDLICYVALGQFICVILALFFPPIRILFTNLIVKNSDSEVLRNLGTRLSAKRMYGLSENLFDSFGYSVAMLIVAIFNIAYARRKVYLIVFSLALLIIPALNSRTGVILAIIGILISVFWGKPRQFLINSFKVVFCLGCIGILAPHIMKLLPETTQAWLEQGVEVIKVFLFEGEKNGALSQIFSSDLQYPSDLLFGACGRPHAFSVFDTTGHQIDSGYVICIWKYGLVGTVLMLVGYLSMYFQSYRRAIDLKSKKILIAFGAIFMVELFKINCIANFNANMLLFGAPFLIQLFGKSENRIDSIN